MDDEPDPEVVVPISAIEHWSYCPRQCGLIHVDRIFDENLYTIRGRLAHERVMSGLETETAGVRAVRDVALRSDRLGLRGKADVVEFHGEVPYPVEYKVGRPRGPHASLQLCAQALCLEEMLGLDVRRGALYHHALHRRREVCFDEGLRRRVRGVIEDIRHMMLRQCVPSAAYLHRCVHCSLAETCMPRVIGTRGRPLGAQDVLFQPLPVGSPDD